MLRAAREADIGFVQSILNDPENFDKLEAYPDSTLAAALQDPEQFLLIWDNETGAAGFCWLRRADPGIKIEEFGMRYPGQGQGRAMFAALLDWFGGLDAPGRLWLIVAADNLRAIRFYSRFGFARIRVVPAAWHRRKGPVADALYMQRCG